MKTYYFNSSSLRFEPVNPMKRYSFYMLVGLSLLLASFKPYSSTLVRDEYIPLDRAKEVFTELKFISMMEELKIRYPDVVWAQSQVESASYTSPIFKENNNMLGIKISTTRASTFIGENRGHAAYKSWRDCLIDYAIWQSTFTRGLSKEQYLNYLGAVYAEDPNYEIKIRRKLKEFKH